jgi:hypothetical protein
MTANYKIVKNLDLFKIFIALNFLKFKKKYFFFLNTHSQKRFSGLHVKSNLNCLSTHPFELQVGSYLRSEDCDIAVQYKHYVQALK